MRYIELGCSHLKINLLVDELQLEHLLRENEAKCHKACKDAFNNTKLLRAENDNAMKLLYPTKLGLLNDVVLLY